MTLMWRNISFACTTSRKHLVHCLSFLCILTDIFGLLTLWLKSSAPQERLLFTAQWSLVNRPVCLIKYGLYTWQQLHSSVYYCFLIESRTSPTLFNQKLFECTLNYCRAISRRAKSVSWQFTSFVQKIIIFHCGLRFVVNSLLVRQV